MDVVDIIETLALHVDEPARQWERKSKTACFNGARVCGGRLGQFHPHSYPMSFLWADIHDVPGLAAAIVSLSGPFIALCETIPEPYNLAHTSNLLFVEAVEASSELHFLGAAILDTELSLEDREKFGRLNPRWSYDIRYWRPETLGQALFNWWD
ncbi:MAG: hypothetical protein AAGI03_07275 [Pseudomonadota bacterium]